MKTIFIDRDGTLIIEPPETFQVNAIDEIEFLPNAISSLKKLSEAGFQLILISNQDGLGTKKNPLENYEKINNFIFQILKSEGIVFSQIFTCPHFPEDKCKCRKPETGLVDEFLRKNNIDYENSYMIGDRETDIQFAKNIGVEGIMIENNVGAYGNTPLIKNYTNNKTPKLNNNILLKIENNKKGVLPYAPTNWLSLTQKILNKPRTAIVSRKTKETEISISLNLDGSGKYSIDTGLKFFDHMLEQLGKHGNFDLEILCNGDLEIDEHHTIEDVALALGECFRKALGDKRGIERYSFEKILPMDEALAQIALDFSGRADCIFSADFSREYVGDFPTEMLFHFYKSFCDAAGLNMNMKIEGKNSHHMIEVSFKSFARCLKESVRVTSYGVSSTKGVL